MPVAAIVSFRLGGNDGVAIESAKWQWALGQLGWSVRTIAGEGPVDHLLPGLAIGATKPPEPDSLVDALRGTDLVIVENLCSLPLNPGAASVVATVCRGRPSVLHHHDLPWQRPAFVGAPPPPDDGGWRHATINQRSRVELAALGISAVTIYNTFDLHAPHGDRAATRRALGLSHDQRVVLQPTRALDRKNVPEGLALAEALGALYWLLGPAEDGYGPELTRLLTAARCPVLHGPGPHGAGERVVDAYAACDLVAMPSTWEGFGNPTIESAVHRRPLAIGSYPVARELEGFGFRWFRSDQPREVDAWLSGSDRSLLEWNYEIANRHFNLNDLPRRLEELLATLPL